MVQGNNARGNVAAEIGKLRIELPKKPQNYNYFKEKMLLMQAQENRVDLDEEQLLFLTDDQCDAFDSDVDEAPTAQTMFMANLCTRNCNQPKRPLNSDYFKEKMLLMQAQENEVDLDEEQLFFLAGRQTNTFGNDVDEGPVQYMAQNEDNIFQADQCDTFDSDVDEAPTAQTMFMANLSSTAPVYDEAGPSYDSDTLSEVQNHDNYLDDMNESHEEHEMKNDVQPNDVVDSDTEYTSNSNLISYEQYV
nr:hypothetical protein [Tanacetum cinerariifolium]